MKTNAGSESTKRDGRWNTEADARNWNVLLHCHWWHVNLCLFSIEIILKNCTFGSYFVLRPQMMSRWWLLPVCFCLLRHSWWHFSFFFSSIVGEHMICRSKPVDECSLSLVMNTRFFGMNEPSTSTVDKWFIQSISLLSSSAVGSLNRMQTWQLAFFTQASCNTCDTAL